MTENKKASESSAELQDKILKAISEFEDQTGLRVSEIRYDLYETFLHNYNPVRRYDISITYK